jgi:hypothetical protein
MRPTNKPVLIILSFLINLLVVGCNCERNPGAPKRKNEKMEEDLPQLDLAANQQKKKELEDRKEGIAKAMKKKFGLDDIEKQAAKKKESGGLGADGLSTRKHAPGLGLKRHKQEPELAQLALEEATLEIQAKSAFGKLKNMPLVPLLEELGQEFGGNIPLSGLLSDAGQQIDKLIADCKKDPVLTNRIADVIENIQLVGGKLRDAIEGILQDDDARLGSSPRAPLERLFDAFSDSLDLPSLGVNIDQFSGSLDEDKIGEINQILSKPIDPNKLSIKVRQAYHQAVAKNSLAAKSGLCAVCVVVEDAIVHLGEALGARLAVIKNIQKQHRLQVG